MNDNLTRLTGIFGFPIKHSLSPVMHNAAFRKLQLNYFYVPFEVTPANLKRAVDSLKILNIAGVNITIPHKEKVIPFLNMIDPLAQKIGSVNTIVNKNGVLTGYNTDGTGFIKDIQSKGFNPKGKTALLVGAGGAGRAIALSLAWAGAGKIFITDEEQKRAKKLSAATPGSEFIPIKNWKEKINESHILINATPAGMHPGEPSLVEKSALRKEIFVYDIVYNRQTELVKCAKQAGAKAFGGTGMLLNQGALAFELWTGVKAPLSLMENELLKALKK